jgi:hypothetical protein
MAVLIGVIAALVGGQAIGAVLAGLSIAQLVTLAQVGGQVGVAGIKIGVAVKRDLDRRFPVKLRASAATSNARIAGSVVAHHVGGPIGWGRAPIVFFYEPPGARS